MKAKYLLVLVTLSAVVLLSACKKNEVEERIIVDTSMDGTSQGNGHKEESRHMLKVTETNAPTSTTVNIKFTPSDNSIEYISVLLPRAQHDVFSYAKLKENALLQLQQEATVAGKSLSEYLNSITMKGTQIKTVTGLTPNTAYGVLTFERKGNTLYGTALNDNFYIQTRYRDKSNLTFQVTSETRGLTTNLTFRPSDKQKKYYLVALKKSGYDRAIESDGMTDEDIIISIFKRSLYKTIEYENQLQEGLDKLLLTGDRLVKIDSDASDVEYVYLCAELVVPDPYTVIVNSDIVKGSFTSGHVDMLTDTIKIETSINEGGSNFSVTLTPSNDDLVYTWQQGVLDGPVTSTTIDDIEKEMRKSPWFGTSSMIYHGSQSYDKLPISSPGKTYYVIAFGLQGKVRVTKRTFVTFETGEPVNFSATEYNFSSLLSTPTSATIRISPSDNRVYYAVGLRKASEEVDLEAAKQDFQEQLNEEYTSFSQANPGSGKNIFVDTYYYKGELVRPFDGLDPSTRYSVYVYTINQTDATVVKVTKLTNDFVMTASIIPGSLQTELIGVYDISTMNPIPIQGLENYRDYALVAIKYTVPEGFSEGKSFLISKTFRGAELDEKKISDTEVIERLNRNFYTVTAGVDSTRYKFYVADWDTPQVSLTYVSKQNGNRSKVDRRVFVTPMKSHLSPIRTLYDALGAAFPGHNNSDTETETASRSSFVVSKYVQLLPGSTTKGLIPHKNDSYKSQGGVPLYRESNHNVFDNNNRSKELIDIKPNYVIVR